MKKVAVFLADGFEEIEALSVVDVLRRAGIYCNTVSIKSEMVEGAHNVVVKADEVMSEDAVEIENYDMIVCPGGLPGAEYLSKDERVLKIIRKFKDMPDKYIAAICASPATVLSAAGVEDGKYITSYPGEEFEKCLEKANYVEELVVVDGNIITSRGPATTLLFAYKLVDILGENSENLKNGMLWNLLEKEDEE